MQRHTVFHSNINALIFNFVPLAFMMPSFGNIHCSYRLFISLQGLKGKSMPLQPKFVERSIQESPRVFTGLAD